MEDQKTATKQERAGFFAAVAAFASWGFLPVFWKQLKDVPALEILCHRIFWSMVFVFVVLLVQGRLREIGEIFKRPRIAALLALSGVAVGLNWLIFIWAVNAGRVLEVSLGYYINPLMTVFLGFIVFRDYLRPVQWIAIGVAAAGLAYQLALFGKLPLAGLGVATTFALYGLIRKVTPVGAISGLFAETLVLAVPALGYLLFLASGGQGAFLLGPVHRDVLLLATGAVTSIPLFCFAYGARRLRLVTVGILQYIGPTISFFLGTFLYNEPLTVTQVITFACVWTAVVLYTVDGVLATRRLAPHRSAR
ncbi:MAG: EamA family transporter RarD [Thermovirgaceae bacterium]